MINIVKADVAEHFAHFFHVPLLYIVGMRIGKVKKSFAEMSDDGVFVQKFLIVELLRQHFLFSGTAETTNATRFLAADDIDFDNVTASEIAAIDPETIGKGTIKPAAEGDVILFKTDENSTAGSKVIAFFH